MRNALRMSSFDDDVNFAASVAVCEASRVNSALSASPRPFFIHLITKKCTGVSFNLNGFCCFLRDIGFWATWATLTSWRPPAGTGWTRNVWEDKKKVKIFNANEESVRHSKHLKSRYFGFISFLVVFNVIYRGLNVSDFPRYSLP